MSAQRYTSPPTSTTNTSSTSSNPGDVLSSFLKEYSKDVIRTVRKEISSGQYAENPQDRAIWYIESQKYFQEKAKEFEKRKASWLTVDQIQAVYQEVHEYLSSENLLDASTRFDEDATETTLVDTIIVRMSCKHAKFSTDTIDTLVRLSAPTSSTSGEATGEDTSAAAVAVATKKIRWYWFLAFAVALSAESVRGAVANCIHICSEPHNNNNEVNATDLWCCLRVYGQIDSRNKDDIDELCASLRSKNAPRVSKEQLLQQQNPLLKQVIIM